MHENKHRVVNLPKINDNTRRILIAVQETTGTKYQNSLYRKIVNLL